MAELELRLLGRFQARCSSGRPVELTTRKARALLAYLALHAGQAQSREKLIALLWSDRAERQGRDSLRQALTALRKGLGAESVALLTVDGDAIAIEPAAVEVDASRFEQLLAAGTPEGLERAVELYRGDFLDGLGVRDPAFEDWMYAERERSWASHRSMASYNSRVAKLNYLCLYLRVRAARRCFSLRWLL